MFISFIVKFILNATCDVISNFSLIVFQVSQIKTMQYIKLKNVFVNLHINIIMYDPFYTVKSVSMHIKLIKYLIFSLSPICFTQIWLGDTTSLLFYER